MTSKQSYLCIPYHMDILCICKDDDGCVSAWLGSLLLWVGSVRLGSALFCSARLGFVLGLSVAMFCSIGRCGMHATLIEATRAPSNCGCSAKKNRKCRKRKSGHLRISANVVSTLGGIPKCPSATLGDIPKCRLDTCGNP